MVMSDVVAAAEKHGCEPEAYLFVIVCAVMIMNILILALQAPPSAFSTSYVLRC